MPGMARTLRIRYDGAICHVAFSGNALMIAASTAAATGKDYLLRLLQNAPDAAPDGLRPGRFVS